MLFILHLTIEVTEANERALYTPNVGIEEEFARPKPGAIIKGQSMLSGSVSMEGVKVHLPTSTSLGEYRKYTYQFIPIEGQKGRCTFVTAPWVT